MRHAMLCYHQGLPPLRVISLSAAGHSAAEHMPLVAIAVHCRSLPFVAFQWHHAKPAVLCSHPILVNVSIKGGSAAPWCPLLCVTQCGAPVLA